MADSNTRLQSSGFRHHVLFWLKEPTNEQHRSEFLRELRKMTEIPEIRHCEIGVPANTPREVVDSSWTFDWLVTFASREDWAVYHDHPIHHEFVDRAKHLWEKVQIYDSLASE